MHAVKVCYYFKSFSSPQFLSLSPCIPLYLIKLQEIKIGIPNIKHTTLDSVLGLWVF